MGVMGYPMAGHIAVAGHDVTVFNRTVAKAEAWTVQYGGSFATTPAVAADGADFVFCCVGDDPDVLSVALGEDGAIPSMKNGAVFIDNSTVSADVAGQLYDAGKASGVQTLDAPVSGGQAGAENGKLTVMVGGDDTAFALALPLMECIKRSGLPIPQSPCTDLFLLKKSSADRARPVATLTKSRALACMIISSALNPV